MPLAHPADSPLLGRKSSCCLGPQGCWEAAQAATLAPKHSLATAERHAQQFVFLLDQA